MGDAYPEIREQQDFIAKVMLAAAFISFILHKYQVPDFHPAVAVAHAHSAFRCGTGIFFQRLEIYHRGFAAA